MNKQQVTAILPYLSRHPARMEALVVGLSRLQTVDESEIDYYAEGTFRRAYQYDISEASLTDHEERLELRLSREGLYDQLPSGFFHSPEAHQPGKSVEKMVSEYRHNRKEEADARKFFRPFEQALFQVRVRSEASEQWLSSGFLNPVQKRLLHSLWPETQAVSEQVQPLLAYLLPLAYKIAGDLPLMEVCFETILGERVRLERKILPDPNGFGAELPGLGVARLGSTLVTAPQEKYRVPTLRMLIGPVSAGGLIAFLPGGEKEPLLGIIKDNFVPLEYAFSWQVEAEGATAAFRLGEPSSAARLGWTTVLT